MPTILLRAELGDYAERVLLTETPELALGIAERLATGGRVRAAAQNRGMLGFHGAWNDGPVSVQTSGLGGPSASIVVEELLRVGVRTFVLLAACRPIGRDAQNGDLIVPIAAAAGDGASRTYLHGDPAVGCADFGLVCALASAATRHGRVAVGSIVTVDLMPAVDHAVEGPDFAREAGVLALDRSSCPLFLLAARHADARSTTVRAASLLVPEGKRIDHAGLMALEALTAVADASARAPH